jgi:hypothetical protein
MGFMVNFGIGLGKSLDQSFQDKEAKRTEMVKYRMQMLEKEKESWKASRAAAKELATQVNTLASVTGISRNNIGALLQSKAVSPEDIMKGKVNVIRDAIDKQQQAVSKPTQEKAPTSASPFPSQKPEAPMGAPAEPMAAPQGIEDMGQPQALAGQVGQDQLQGGPQAPQMAQDPRQAIQPPPPVPQPQAAPQEQGTMAWAGDKLRQGLFGRDIEGAGAEGDRMFMQANSMTPDDLRAMQDYSSPEYAVDEGSKFNFQTGEQYDPMKIIMNAKAGDIKPGMHETFHKAALAGDVPTALATMFTEAEKQERAIAASRANAELAASTSRANASAGGGQPSNLEKMNRYIMSLPEGSPERKAAERLAYNSKSGTLQDDLNNIETNAMGKLGITEADVAKAQLSRIARDKAEGGAGVPEGVEAMLRKQAGME